MNKIKLTNSRARNFPFDVRKSEISDRYKTHADREKLCHLINFLLASSSIFFLDLNSKFIWENFRSISNLNFCCSKISSTFFSAHFHSLYCRVGGTGEHRRKIDDKWNWRISRFYDYFVPLTHCDLNEFLFFFFHFMLSQWFTSLGTLFLCVTRIRTVEWNQKCANLRFTSANRGPTSTATRVKVVSLHRRDERVRRKKNSLT